MSKINDGGPAFPVPLNPGQPWQGMAPCDGMTLRDYFAAKAMQGLLARAFTKDERGRPFVEWVAGFSYELADEMLKAREGGAT